MDKSENKYNKGFVVKLCLLATMNCFLCGYNIGVLNASIYNVAYTLG